MTDFKKKERALLMSICMTEKIPIALGEQLLKSAETLSYEIQSPSLRVKEYGDLITYHFSQKTSDKL